MLEFTVTLTITYCTLMGGDTLTRSTHVCDCLQSHSLDTLIEMQNASSSSSPLQPNPPPARTRILQRFRNAFCAALSVLHPKPRLKLSSMESGSVPDDSGHRAVSNTLDYAATLDPTAVQICRHADGEKWVLGRGSYGIVSHY